jgi:hypothetical protein
MNLADGTLGFKRARLNNESYMRVYRQTYSRDSGAEVLVRLFPDLPAPNTNPPIRRSGLQVFKHNLRFLQEATNVSITVACTSYMAISAWRCLLEKFIQSGAETRGPTGSIYSFLGPGELIASLSLAITEGLLPSVYLRREW